jgi:AraC-like DNA-binding protein
MRHTASEPIVRGYAVTHPPGTVVPPQPPGWDQLVYAAAGVLTVETTSGTWVVPPRRAVWVPDGERHQIVLTSRAKVRNLYLVPGLVALPRACRAVDVPPLLRELIVHAVVNAPFYQDEPAGQRLIGVIGDLLVALPTAPLLLPMPNDQRARAVAERMAAEPASTVALASLAASAGASRRTIERCFVAETGMSVGVWRQRMRLLAALRLLADGFPVTDVAYGVGYATPSAFGAMFLREMGTSPSRYFAEVQLKPQRA